MSKENNAGEEHPSSLKRDLFLCSLAFLAALAVGTAFLLWGTKAGSIVVLGIPISYIIIATVITRVT